MVDKIAESIAGECAKLNIPTNDPKPTYNIWLAWNICNLLTFIPFVGLAALVTFILYWVKVAEFKNLIIGNKIITYLTQKEMFSMQIKSCEKYSHEMNDRNKNP